MSRGEQRISQIKNSKPFFRLDILIYGIIAIIICVLFFLFVFLKGNADVQGFSVYSGNVKVLEYHFLQDRIEVNSQFSDDVIFNDDENSITIYTNSQKSEYNVIQFDSKAKKVWMKDSTCSIKKDCVYFSPIDNKGGVIYCSPHDIKILPVGNVQSSPITG